MADKISNASDIMSITSYSVNGSLILSGIFDILNKNAAAFGVILGILTFLTNVYFQYLNHKVLEKRIKIEHEKNLEDFTDIP